MKNSIWNAVEEAHIIAVGGHIRPDGDCVGSCSAMYSYIKKVYPDKEVYVYFDKVPAVFGYINAVNEAITDYRDVMADLFISLDLSDPERLGDAKPYFDNADITINIDHHISNPGFADINCVFPDSSSTCEVVYELFDDAFIDKEIAEALYTGIVHDTGVFQYSCAGKRTMEIAGILVEKGIDKSRIIDESFYEKTYKQNLILGRCLLESYLCLENKCIVSVATAEIMKEYEADTEDLDGIVNQLRITKGVKAAVFIYELSDKEYKVSLRANGDVNVSRAAVIFGGGGHIKAAGCTLRGELSEELPKLISEVDKSIKEAGE